MVHIKDGKRGGIIHKETPESPVGVESETSTFILSNKMPVEPVACRVRFSGNHDGLTGHDGDRIELERVIADAGREDTSKWDVLRETSGRCGIMRFPGGHCA